jgi:hypothetical protein
MSKRIVKKVDPNQQTIQNMFSKGPGPEKVVRSVSELTTSNVLVSDDPIVQEYYASLSEKEKRAHSIAIDKLGTSYDIVRTHGFLRWQKTRK